MAKFSNRMNSFFLQCLVIDPTFGLSEMYRSGANSETDFSLSMSKDMMQRAIEERNPTIYSTDNFSPTVATNLQEVKAVKKQSVAVITAKGVMLSEGGLCTPSIDLTCNQIAAAASNPNISAIVIRAHSGGGEVTAAQRLSNAIVEAKTQKPVLMAVDGIAASGMYWAAAFCDEIIMLGDTTRVGSIGVVIEFSKERVAELKADLESILSDGSEGKRAFIRALMDGDHQYIKNTALNPTMKIFGDVVKKGRKNSNIKLTDNEGFGMSFIKSEGNMLGGRMTIDANEAIRAGLADGKGTMNTVLKRAVFLANKRQRQERAAANLKLAIK